MENKWNVLKKDDESTKDYLSRLSFNKDEYNLTWNDISDLMSSQCNENKTADAYRKWFTPYLQGYKDAIGNTPNFLDVDDLEMKKIELRKEQIKLQSTKIEFDRKLRQYSRFELFYENVGKYIEALEVPDFELRPIDLIKERESEYVLAIADIHYNAYFSSLNNEYSREECLNRFNKLLSEMIDKIRDEKITHIKVLNLGDSIQGMLRISDVAMNETSVVYSVVEISRLIANFLNALSKYCTLEYYHVPMANHSQTRPLNTKASELAIEDMELIIINYIHDLLRDNERVIVYNKYLFDFLTFDIFDFKCIAMHGHQFKQMKDIENSLKHLSMQHSILYDICFLGHKHTANEMTIGESGEHNTEVLMSPSFIGSCPYSDKLMVGSKASVKLYQFDKRYGHINTNTIILN